MKIKTVADNTPSPRRGKWEMKLKLMVLSLVGSIGLSTSAAAEERPNILLFFVDDMGWKDLACYGGQFAETPMADRLASEGMRFTDAYASPVCSPTRASLLTGQNAGRHTMWEVINVLERPYAKLKSPEKATQLDQNVITYANVLNEVGYTCGTFGKWHVGRTPQAHGFVAFDPKIRDPKLAEYAAKNDFKSHGSITAKAIEFMRENKDRPFFLEVSHYMVHAPLTARKDLTEKYLAKLRETGTTDTHLVYAAMIEMVDESLGLILNELETLGLADNTMVLFYSDNGGLVSDMYLKDPTPLAADLRPLRGQKGSLYEGGIRVPLIVKWPGKVKPGTLSAEPVDSYDLYPTFVELAGGKLPGKQPIDGRSLVPLVTGQVSSLGRDAIHWHFPTSQWTRSPHGAIRQGRYKLIEHFEDNRIELFDLQDDIGETINLVGSQPEKARAMLNQLRQWRDSVGAPMPTPNPDFDPTRAHQFSAPAWLTRPANSRAPAAKAH